MTMIERLARVIDDIYFDPGTNTHEMAKRAAKVAIEEVAAWLEKQRGDIPAHGWEFAAALQEGKEVAG
ncbi:hypothetical protein [Rhizobium sp.]|uniref:hypothetical protein n=1 Tax=Rhizobium sp. TaxID=391 RepID=UPI003F8202AF